jgi:arginine-tRNA-protein transferase
MPLRWPLSRITGPELDRCLAEGDRRSGPFLYRTCCPSCRKCEAIRIAVDSFRIGRTQRRIKRKGDAQITVKAGPPRVDSTRVALFNKHRNERGLATDDGDIDEDGYSSFLVESCVETIELRYLFEDRLIAVALVDCGAASISAVYCYFDPEHSRLSLGTYAILKQIELCLETRRRYLYLGYYIATSPRMTYKSRFRPHERLVDGCWHAFG